MGSKWGPASDDSDRDNVTSGWVYFMRAAKLNLIKIGFTVEHPDKRRREIQPNSPDILQKMGVINGTPTLERRLHNRFKPLRRHNEWFFGHPALIDFIAAEGKPWPDPGANPIVFTYEESWALRDEWSRKSITTLNSVELDRLRRYEWFGEIQPGVIDPDWTHREPYPHPVRAMETPAFRHGEETRASVAKEPLVLDIKARVGYPRAIARRHSLGSHG